jgi:hypothetical protein
VERARVGVLVAVIRLLDGNEAEEGNEEEDKGRMVAEEAHLPESSSTSNSPLEFNAFLWSPGTISWSFSPSSSSELLSNKITMGAVISVSLLYVPVV